MPDLSDRDRVTAILTLAEAATEGDWRQDGFPEFDDGDDGFYPILGGGVEGSAQEHLIATVGLFCNKNAETDAAFIAASRSEAPWLARRLLEALDTIDRLEAENETKVDSTGTCDWGSCDGLTVAVVETRGHGWLSVCRHHALQALVPTNRA